MRPAIIAMTAVMDAISPSVSITRPHARQIRLGLLCLTAALTIAGAPGAALAASPKLKDIFSFGNLRGIAPRAELIADGAGNLYGTTARGGKHGYGVVFELSPPAQGRTAWTEQVLFSFKGTNGSQPYAGLIADGAGNLYGTTVVGGKHGHGVVFELSPPAQGQTAWTDKVLIAFKRTDGGVPNAGLIADGAGNLYGTTSHGGANNHGAVFELSPPAQGQTAWTEQVLFAFNGTNGGGPFAGLIADGAGNLYGSTIRGGAYKDGVVFELSPPTQGQTAWTEQVLFSFHGTNGLFSEAVLIADGAGNLYGTTLEGGANNDGVVFELSPPTQGQTAWTEQVLSSFNGTNGNGPEAALIADGAGNLYGTTWSGGANNYGVVFELSPPAQGQTGWTEQVLSSFNWTNGAIARAGLIADGAGNLYGSTAEGGKHDGDGVVFELKDTGYSPPRR